MAGKPKTIDEYLAALSDDKRAALEKRREIVEFEQKGKIKADYGEKILERLSVDLADRFGKGFSAENLRLMRKFHLTFGKSKTLSRKSTIQQTMSAKSQKNQTVSGKFEPILSWSYYCELLKGDEPLPDPFMNRRRFKIIGL
jgi:hypothetical protein